MSTSYPAVSYVTKSVVQTQTITSPGKKTTITLPGQTKTLPGTTIVTTEVRTLPEKRVTITESGMIRTITEPLSTVGIPTTKTVPPTTVSVPAKTVTVTPILSVTVCPAPTGQSKPLAPDSDLTFGCKPGYVCNPKMPSGCNFWPGSPSSDYCCKEEDCIPSPPLTNVTWTQCKTEYFPPSYGYFNLNPEAFGLPYGIFEYETYEAVKDGHKTTITTGNWKSQSSLTNWPRPSSTNALNRRTHHPKYNETQGCRGYHAVGKRAVTPAICFDDCNNAYLIAQAVGKVDKLCEAGSSFRESYNSCAACILANSDATSNNIGDYVQPEFAQFLNFCNGQRAGTPSKSAVNTPEPVVTAGPSIETKTQADASTSGFMAVPSSVILSDNSPPTPSQPPTTEVPVSTAAPASTLASMLPTDPASVLSHAETSGTTPVASETVTQPTLAVSSAAVSTDSPSESPKDTSTASSSSPNSDDANATHSATSNSSDHNSSTEATSTTVLSRTQSETASHGDHKSSDGKASTTASGSAHGGQGHKGTGATGTATGTGTLLSADNTGSSPPVRASVVIAAAPYAYSRARLIIAAAPVLFHLVM